jgi:hypothetical protein
MKALLLPDTSKKESEEHVSEDGIAEVQENLEDTLGRLIIEDGKSCYVSNISWTNLADQVRCKPST